MVTPPHILLVDDSDKDAELVCVALKHHKLANEILHLHDGAEALDYLYRRGEFAEWPKAQPVVVLLDLKMPKVDGLEVLRQIKSDPQLSAIPVVAMTSSREEQDLVASYALGANGYVVKPVNFKGFVEAIRQIGRFWVVLNEPPTCCIPKSSTTDR